MLRIGYTLLIIMILNGCASHPRVATKRMAVGEVEYGYAFSIENILLAIASLVKNKKEYNLYTKKIGELMPLEGRLNKYTRKKFPIVFIDFAHTPDAIKKILLSIKKHFPDKKIITLFGCGGDRSYEKRKLMGKIADQYSEKIFIANDNPRSEDPKKIAKQIVKGINKNKYNL